MNAVDRLMGVVCTLLGLFIVTQTAVSTPYAYGNRWTGWAILMVVGAVNLLVGLYTLLGHGRKNSGR